MQKAKDLGADEIINHNTDNLREKIKEFTRIADICAELCLSLITI